MQRETMSNIRGESIAGAIGLLPPLNYKVQAMNARSKSIAPYQAARDLMCRKPPVVMLLELLSMLVALAILYC